MSKRTHLETPATIELIETEQVLHDRRIPLPDRVREGLDLDAEDGTIYWSYDSDNYHLVLSPRPLTKDRFSGAWKPTGVYTYSTPKIRPPEDLPDVILSRFVEGTPVTYVAMNDMLTKENPAVLLLFEDMLSQLGITGTNDETEPPAELHYPDFFRG